MIDVSVSWLASATKGKLVHIGSQKIVNNISTDSRTIKEGDCFIALKGQNFDGHNFIKECIDKKVKVFIVNSLFFRNNQNIFKGDISVITVKDTYQALTNLALNYRTDFIFDKKIIAITGSSGKTTTKFLIAQLLSYKYNVEFSPKSFNNNIGVPLSLFKINNDTEIGVIEVGMNHKGEIRKLSKIISPDVGIITNIGFAHIEFLKTTRNIALAKSELFEGMKEGNVVFINKLTRHLDVIENNAKKHNLIIRYFDPSKAKVITNKGIDGIVFEYDGVNFETNVPGVHNIENLVCALEVCKSFEIDIKDLVPIIRKLNLPEMRSNIIKGKFTIIDDSYNANPDSMKKAIDLLESTTSNGKKIAVLGDMLELGEMSNNLHLEIAKYLLDKNIDYIICYGEKFALVYDFLLQNGKPKDKVISTNSITETAEILNYIVKEGDTILIKASRGMRLNEISSFLENKLKEVV
ncbi:MAG: UDP-N-acetylmuramoyl-tripeptide--D-alanyl-D-alanine ligase [Brevinematia bacterium]